MDIVKTILRLSFFILGCIMLMFALLVISVDIDSVLFFLGFALIFYLLGYKYTFAIVETLCVKIVNLLHIDKKYKNIWRDLNHENLHYNLATKELKLNTKNYLFEQIVSVEFIANSKVVTEKVLLKLDTVKNLEIKLGTRIKKITYRHFKYITSTKISDKNKDKFIKKAISDYKQITKITRKRKKKKIRKTKKL